MGNCSYYGQTAPDDMPDLGRFSPALQQAFAVVDELQYKLKTLLRHQVRPDGAVVLEDIDLLEKHLRTAQKELLESVSEISPEER